jgi:diketogulonate reductase-like aldo/keto reductase
VGTAIRESGLRRAELFVTTKFDGGDVRRELDGSLARVRRISGFMQGGRLMTARC